MESDDLKPVLHCYCAASTLEPHMLVCTECKKYFHPSCLKTGVPSPLIGDIYFKFTCENCSPNSQELVVRIKLQWILVIIIALYNLKLEGGGKCGYFRWREHICRFIDKHWKVFFGTEKKKSATWHGTVAGALSTGANRYFVSGVEELRENGWWSLKSLTLPTIDEVDSIMASMRIYRKQKYTSLLETPPVVEGSRQRKPNVLEAALQLKEMKEYMPETPRFYKPKKKKVNKNANKAKNFNAFDTSDFENFCQGVPKIIMKNEDISPDNMNINIAETKNDNMDLDINNPPDLFNFPELLTPSSSFSSFFDEVKSEDNIDKTSSQLTSLEYESEEESSNSSKAVGSHRKVQHPDTSRKRKAVTRQESPIKETVHTEPKFLLMSPYEEEQLLHKLENYTVAMNDNPEVKRLYRKLIVRKLKRSRNIPIFDIDNIVRSLAGVDAIDNSEQEETNKHLLVSKSQTILDHYQVSQANLRGSSIYHTSFVTRLIGLEDEQLESIVSPYTERVLPPFIFRDYKTKPLKLKLLEEIISKVNKSNPDWQMPERNPIDFSYVRPHHIPAVNAMCNEFFWPGVDMSESLQYPDFSCVALYRKLIIGFAFMVPDVKYNEAYITFIFCHPEWRHAGIAKFMLYHLIQTCMGKDITLHVSATSPAVMLYQKFGFKIEELVLDFYDKYLPPDSKECRHALFFRLSR